MQPTRGQRRRQRMWSERMRIQCGYGRCVMPHAMPSVLCSPYTDCVRCLAFAVSLSNVIVCQEHSQEPTVATVVNMNLRNCVCNCWKHTLITVAATLGSNRPATPFQQPAHGHSEAGTRGGVPGTRACGSVAVASHPGMCANGPAVHSVRPGSRARLLHLAMRNRLVEPVM